MNDVHRTSERSRSTGCDALAEWALAHGLSWVVGAVCVSLLATRVPHYLTCPGSAISTHSQRLPSLGTPESSVSPCSRHNFPGQTYIFWMLGKAVGWSHTAAFYAVDVAFLVMLGAALMARSVRRFHGPLPGLVAYLAFLAHYLSLDLAGVPMGLAGGVPGGGGGACP
jgi:hypothetical protein